MESYTGLTPLHDLVAAKFAYAYNPEVETANLLSWERTEVLLGICPDMTLVRLFRPFIDRGPPHAFVVGLSWAVSIDAGPEFFQRGFLIEGDWQDSVYEFPIESEDINLANLHSNFEEVAAKDYLIKVISEADFTSRLR